MKKIIALLLTLLMVLPFAVSCANNNGNPGDTTTAAGTQSGDETTGDETTAKPPKPVVEYDKETVGLKIAELIEANYPNNGHPRLIFTQDRIDFLKSQMGNGSIFDKEYRNAKKQANAYLTSKPSGKNIYDGLRMSSPVQSVVFYCGIAYFCTGDEQFARRAIDEMLDTAAYDDWNPYHFLDVGNVCVGMGLGYDWFYSVMTEEERTTIREAILKFGIGEGMKDYGNKIRKRTYKWYQEDPGDNWKFICNGGLGLCCMAIFDDCNEEQRKTCTDALTFGYNDLYKFIRNCYNQEDGSYVEGLSYWSYGGQYLGIYSTGLVSAAGTNFDLTDAEGIKKTGYFPIYTSSNNGLSFCFGDGSEQYCKDPYFLWLGHEFDAPEIGYFRYKYIKGGEYNIQDLFWLFPEDNFEKVEMGTDYGAVGTTNATFRTSWNDGAMFIGCHWGDEDVPHGHKDMGEFCLDYGGQRFLLDLGKEDYNLPGCYDSYRVISEGHNTLTINPKTMLKSHGGQKSSAEAYVNKYKSSDTDSFAVCDMTSAYDIKSVQRGIRLFKADSIAILQDEISCTAADEIYWYAHTKAEIKLLDGGKAAVLTLNGKSLRATIQSGDAVFTIEDAKSSLYAKNVANQTPNTGVQKLAIKLTGSDSYTLTVAFTPGNYQGELPAVTAIADWN